MRGAAAAAGSNQGLASTPRVIPLPTGCQRQLSWGVATWVRNQHVYLGSLWARTDAKVAARN
ncbi:hypothetical protein PC129_g11207 [Phytophthora cactorum]|uniref:Uncharacterized protein n=1 Tax=Phytophthora cactorum TaxID=29920 RepID=A0A8T1L2B9_9STRA|nr:hypothetical protein Pcac1_g16461 [Phytophthora cactorum]KAG2901190.1 hypothetical protein PC114_g13272 [Phytophthora cactorum]KAG2933777.1 hypothetical protein PC117_g12786 [Phytophthora cactorum]KAG3015934.1 hypothetical protein PC120_g11898 [Phytophthora cactorum]KAG3029066.1 hypothetical protein PC119_g6781 [Phytophthora cactorum]